MTKEMQTEAQITPRYMLLLIGMVPAVSTLYYLLGTHFFQSPLSFEEYLVFISLLAIVITGGYQLFFWVQRNNYHYKTRCFVSPLDKFIPFWPSCVWIYSFLYYAAIGLVVISIQSITEGVYLIFGGILLLLVQMFFFYFFPFTVPSEYREYKDNTISTRYLKFVQAKDNGRNCMPSMHCSVAMYVSLILYSSIGNISWLFIISIAASCLLVKQHQMADIPPGIALGWIIWMVAPVV